VSFIAVESEIFLQPSRKNGLRKNGPRVLRQYRTVEVIGKPSFMVEKRF